MVLSKHPRLSLRVSKCTKPKTRLTPHSLHPPGQRHRHPLRRPFPSKKYAPSPFSTSTSSPNPSSPILSPGRKANQKGALAVGWGNAQSDPGFGTSTDTTSVKAKMVNLIASVRTLMRSELGPPLSHFLFEGCGIEGRYRIGRRADGRDSTADSDQYSGDRLRACFGMSRGGRLLGEARGSGELYGISGILEADGFTTAWRSADKN